MASETVIRPTLKLVSAPLNPIPIVDHFRSHPLCELSYSQISPSNHTSLVKNVDVPTQR